MSMLRRQAGELREVADRLWKHGRFVGFGGNVNIDPLMQDAAVIMREAAKTIESLRDRLQELQGVGGESNYTRLFGTPEMAARTIASVLCDDRVDSLFCEECPLHDGCYGTRPMPEWLRGDAE